MKMNCEKEIERQVREFTAATSKSVWAMLSAGVFFVVSFGWWMTARNFRLMDD